MAERWLKVEVQKTRSSEVYIKVDDADPRFAAIFAPPKDAQLKGILHLTADARRAAEQAADELLDDFAWEDDDGSVSSGVVNEVSASEATEYAAWDAVAGKIVERA